MAGKEATVYIVDVGRSMGQQNHDRNESDLDYAMRYIWDKITTTVSTGRKTLLAGVIAFRTKGTNNELADGDPSYNNISVLAELEQ
jgi:ATP-dependent DNA helicase 2 subunit 2